MLQNIENVDTPFLWVDLDRMEENIASLSAYFRDRKLNWRPHTKGIKIPEISKMALEAGASGITCAKLSEAEIMAASGINDILIANKVVGTSKIERLCILAEKINVIVAVDDSGIALQMAKAAKLIIFFFNALIKSFSFIIKPLATLIMPAWFFISFKSRILISLNEVLLRLQQRTTISDFFKRLFLLVLIIFFFLFIGLPSLNNILS